MTEPALGPHLADMQAILGSGFARLRHGDYLLLRITRRDQARQWLARLLDGKALRSVADLGNGDWSSVATLAFSFRGLRRLGIHASARAPFPTPFRAGMTSPARRVLLRDGPTDSWDWGDTRWPGRRDRRVDVLLIHHRSTAQLAADDLLDPALIEASGFRIVERIGMCPAYAERTVDGQRVAAGEPFGFADGIAQPVLAGMPMSSAQRQAKARAGAMFADRVIAAGEFILGHDNEYGEPAHCPSVDGWSGSAGFGMNGSYLAVRQIYQDTTAFRAFERQHASPAGAAPLAEKMIGRHKDGRPLLTQPRAPQEEDAFRYRLDDLEGLQCPRGAHVRRANPRDSLGWDIQSGLRIARLHRLLRRGRTYARRDRPCAGDAQPPCDDLSYRDRCGEGLFFMALNADLDRQFEFVQQRWIGNRGFANLADEDDPAVGVAGDRAFSTPAMPIGRRLEGFGQFTRTVGGGYFFLPGLRALRFIAGLATQPRQG